MSLQPFHLIHTLVNVNEPYTSFSLVLETLKKHDPKRKCFRSIGGVLVERTVADVMPALQYNAEQVSLLWFPTWRALLHPI